MSVNSFLLGGVNYFRHTIPKVKTDEDKMLPASPDLEAGIVQEERASTPPGETFISFAQINKTDPARDKRDDGFRFGKRGGRGKEEWRERQKERIKNPSETIVMTSAYAIAEKNDSVSGKASVIDIDTLKDIGLLNGKPIPVGKRHTVMGEVVMNGVLSRPTDQIDVLRKRQFIIQSLLDIPLLREELDDCLPKMQAGEKQLLTFWNEETRLPGKLDGAYYKMEGFIGDALNNNSWSLGGRYGANGAQTLLRLAHVGTSAVLCPLYGAVKLAKPVYRFFGMGELPAMSSILENYVRAFGNLGGGGGRGRGGLNLIYTVALLMPGDLAPAASSFALGFFSATRFRMQVGEIKSDLSLEAEIQKKLVSIASYYKGMKHIYELLSDRPEIKGSFEHFTKLENFMNDPKLSTLFSTLESSTFDSEADYCFGRGNVLLAWRLLSENQDVQAGFEVGLLSMGEIDSYLSLANEMEKHKDHSKTQLCFAEYSENTVYPELEIKNVWHPLVKEENVVTNSISFGVEGFARNAIVTGPNGSGKSTILRSLAFSIVLALSYGIGCGSSIRLPLFHYVRSSMNPSDSLEGGVSLFEAQSQLIAKIEKELESVPEGKFTFLILDELYTGTNAEQGAALTKSTVEMLFKKFNNIGIIVTHHDSVTTVELPSEKGIPVFKNYKFAFTEELKPTFHLEEGISDVKLAIDVAAKQGVSVGITRRAQEIINEGRAEGRRRVRDNV